MQHHNTTTPFSAIRLPRGATTHDASDSFHLTSSAPSVSLSPSSDCEKSEKKSGFSESLHQSMAEGAASLPGFNYFEETLRKMRESGKRPKYPLSAFCLFTHQRRAEIGDKNKEIATKQLALQIKTEWKQLEDKSPYQDKARSDYQDYRRLVDIWKREFGADASPGDDKTILRRRSQPEKQAEGICLNLGGDQQAKGGLESSPKRRRTSIKRGSQGGLFAGGSYPILEDLPNVELQAALQAGREIGLPVDGEGATPRAESSAVTEQEVKHSFQQDTQPPLKLQGSSKQNIYPIKQAIMPIMSGEAAKPLVSRDPEPALKSLPRLVIKLDLSAEAGAAKTSGPEVGREAIVENEYLSTIVRNSNTQSQIIDIGLKSEQNTTLSDLPNRSNCKMVSKGAKRPPRRRDASRAVHLACPSSFQLVQ